jgi:hypothetical protein
MTGNGRHWRLRGKVGNSHEGVRWVDVYVKRSNGQWFAAGCASFYGPGSQIWDDFYWSESANGIPTGEVEARPSATLCT